MATVLRSIVFALLVTWMTGAALADGQRVILVLDASGSMWGQIGGATKMEIAKDVVGRIIGKWNDGDELGLVAYGHREKGSCSDIETLIEPGPLDATRYAAAVNGLSPKGKTPMTQSIRQAAEALKFTEKSATVILVSDGIETCDPDPCAVAAELERLGVGLTVHTVGFGLDDKAAVKQLACLAEATGGISILAENAEELKTALDRTVQAEAVAAAPEPEPDPAFNLTGTVIMAEGAEALPRQFASPAWEIHRSLSGTKGDWLKTEYGSPMKTRIEEPGDYLVSVTNDVARIEVPLVIEAGTPVDLALSFEGGLVTFRGLMEAGKPVTDASAAWELQDANGQWLATKYGPEASFFSNAGVYRIKLALGEASVTQDVVVTAGKSDIREITLGGGTVTVRGVLAPGGPELTGSAAIELLKGEAGADGTHQWINTKYGANAEFKVPAGKYRVRAVQDLAVGIADIEVKPGETTAVEISVEGGFVSVAASPDVTIESYAGERYLATDYNGKMNRAFGSGTIRIIARKPDGTVIAERDVEVRAGQRTELQLP
jgi:Ca-activated chloride channel homolog